MLGSAAPLVAVPTSALAYSPSGRIVAAEDMDIVNMVEAVGDMVPVVHMGDAVLLL